MTDTGQWSKPTVKAGDSTAGELLPCPFCGSQDIRAMPMSMFNDGDESDRRWWVGCANALDHDADTFAASKDGRYYT